ISQEGASDLSLVVNRKVGTDVGAPTQPDYSPPQGSTNDRQLGNTAAGDSPASNPFTPSGGGGGTLGKVTSGGPGDTYAVDLYANGTGGGATSSVSAKVPQIDPAATVPANTWVVVLQA